MVTVKEASALIRQKFKDAGIENYIFEANCLLQHFLNLSYTQLITYSAKETENFDLIIAAADKRITGYPLQYILGEWEFFGLPFKVGEGVLIPRQDTETLIESVLENTRKFKKCRIADLCSGSGCIAISLQKNLNNSNVFAVEYSEFALNYLKQNITLNSADITVIEGNVLDKSVYCQLPELDIIVSNPPYLTENDMSKLQKEVTFEPSMALAGGYDGLYFYREITNLWKHKLSDGGMIFYEIGINQQDDVAAILYSNGFSDIKFYHDLNNIIRVVSGVLK